MPAPRISVFPKCYFDELVTGRGNYVEWIHDAATLGETGQGINDYDAIFRILRSVNFTGWISVEDGMDGLDELHRSVEFLKQKRKEYYKDE